MRRFAVLAFLLASLGLVGTTVAQAAGLGLRPPSLTSALASHPCPGAVTAMTTAGATSATTVAVTAPTACAGRTLAVAVPVSGGARTGSGVVPSSGQLTVDLDGAYTPAADLPVRVTVNGWHSPVTWTWTPPPAAGPAVACRIVNHPQGTCTAEIVGFTSWGHPTTTHFQADIRVTGHHSANGQVWELTFDFGSSQYPFVPRGLQSNGGLVLQSGCADLPRMVVGGNPAWAGPYDQVRAGQTRTVYLQGYRTQSGNLLTCG